MNYYCLIAGLPDIQAEDTKTTISMLEFKNELLEQLSALDTELLKLVFANYDNANFLAYLNNKDAALNPLGNLSSTNWAELLALMQEVENPNDKRLLPYIQKFYHTFGNEKVNAEGVLNVDYLSGLYYEYAMQNSNSFLSNWFEFNLNINNILSAYACRKHGFDQRTMVLGNNEVALAIKTSNARDFGLAGLFEQLDVVLRIAEENDLLEREKKIDALKWSWLEENTFFNYFSIEKVLAYVLKIEMIERWKTLSVEKGTQIFRQLLVGMKEGVKLETV
ncbi:MAG: hypothetical protein AUK44_05855 [Porphyromonadaceae bacterium CG2_30_38_12]|nr:MAG: hypothetical protein AUK44_05855 [Porphyromonadaceae bacterium CG2_30_38_12]